MCGRFAFQVTSEQLAAYFALADPPAVSPRFNIAPSQLAPVIRLNRAGQRRFGEIRWGLIPFWAKDGSIGGRTINARAETVAEKPAYRTPFRRRRCLVLASGFYEWHTTAAGKVPVYFSHADDQPIAFAGLWDRWQDPGGELVDSCSIVTTAARGVPAPYHDRMPAILAQDQYQGWMSRETDLNTLLTWLGELPDPPLKVWPVSKAVNDPRNDGPELLREVGD